ncbi:MAG: family 16 glycosylhydrolase [Bacteroidota bacterium]
MKTSAFILLLIVVPEFLSAKIYKGAEYRTKEAFTYGRFEVRMKSAQREGMLASFFTYHEITSTADWNEIDIEILGRYSDDIQFNPITPGQINHVSHYQTLFNPALDFHTYAFEWTPTYVAWFVEGKEVHRQTGAHIEALNLPQKIMMNIWNPTYPNWAGEWNENVLPAFAYYDWVSYSAFTPDSGTTGTDSNFTLKWKDEFDSWDQTRWEKATHTWGGNGCDFVHENAVFKDGKLILCLTKETALGFTDNVTPNVNVARAEKDGILIVFTEEVDSVSATTPSNYLITGKSVTNAVLYSDQKRVKLTVAEYDTAAISNVIITNVKDRFNPANAITVKNVNVTKTQPLNFPAKINCGGPAYKDYLPDQPWGPAVEYGYMDGAAYQNNYTFTGTLDPGVFNSELNGAAKYMVRVPNGTYAVILMMSENFFSASGKRVFTYAVQGKVIETNLDLFAKVGKSKIYQKMVPNVIVTEGILDIHFMTAMDNAVVNGIQIIPLQTNIDETINLSPKEWKIGQNYPNPFNGSTIIPAEFSSPDNIAIRFFDTLGRKVSEIPVGFVSAGRYNFNWDAKDANGRPLASGVYYYAVEGAAQKTFKKLVLVQ